MEARKYFLSKYPNNHCPGKEIIMQLISILLFDGLEDEISANFQSIVARLGYAVAGNEKLSLLNNNKIQVPSIVQTDVEEDLVIRTRYAAGVSSPGGTLSYANRNFTFGTNGSLTFPNGTVQTTAYTPVTGSWAVNVGNYAYSFTVPANGAYHMWVRGNIPNGIISYIATVHITNPNVPVIGSQRGYNYTDGGSPILLTSLPNQFIGTEGQIATGGISGTTNNTFTFGINNSSGSTQTVYYGYTKI